MRFRLAEKLGWLGVVFAVLFWVVEASLHVYVFGCEHGVFHHMFRMEEHEIWMRGVVVFLFISFGLYGQLIVGKRRKAEARAQIAHSELHQVFETAADGMRVVDKDCNVLRVNSTFSHLAGMGKGEAIGKKCYETFSGPLCHTPQCTLRGILNGEVRVEYDVEKLRPDGTRVDCILTATPFYGPGGDVVGIVEDFKDISVRKRMEEELREHRNHLETMVDERTTQLTATNEELQQEIADRVQTEGELLRIKLGLEEANHRLQENQAQLIHSEKMASIGQLAAGVAHEINNPVGFINSNLTALDEYRRDLTELIRAYMKLEERLADGPAVPCKEDASGMIENIRSLKDKMDVDFVLDDFEKIISESREGTDRVKKIVQDLKDFSHIDQAELKWTDLNKGLNSCLNIAWNEIKYKATVTKDYGDIPEVLCYPQQIYQVLTNILVNAAQAIEDKGEIRITTGLLNGDRPMIEIRISDTGQGVPPENLLKIFDPFFTTKPIGKGTGLGLNMAYKIISKHQGEIKVESEVGKGTTFIIRLPVDGPEANSG
ncbi:MAG: ATP-binding protein [Pseudomonadota bacterium]